MARGNQTTWRQRFGLVEKELPPREQPHVEREKDYVIELRTTGDDQAIMLFGPMRRWDAVSRVRWLRDQYGEHAATVLPWPLRPWNAEETVAFMNEAKRELDRRTK